MGYEAIRENIKFLLRYLTTVFSDVVLDLVENQRFTYRDLKTTLENIASQAFTRAMGIEETIQDECTEVLNMGFLKHVISMVTSPLNDEDPIE